MFTSGVVTWDAGWRERQLWVGVWKRCRVDETTGVWKTLSLAFLPESVFISRAKEGYGQSISAGRARYFGDVFCCWRVSVTLYYRKCLKFPCQVQLLGFWMSVRLPWAEQVTAVRDPSSFASALLQRAGALPLRRLESCFFSPLSLLLPFTSFSVSFSYWGIIFVSCEPMSTKF